MKSHHLSASFLVLLLSASRLCGETPEEREFKQLRAQHEQATAAALEPINRRYQWALDQLLRRTPPAAQPELARQLTAEIQATGGAASATAATATPSVPGAPARQPTKADLKRLFEDSQWTAYSGNEAVPDQLHGLFIFKRDGSFVASQGGGGWNEHRWWDVEAPDTLKIYYEHPKSKNPRYHTFRVDFSGKSAKVDALLGGLAGDGFIKYDKPFKAH